METPNEDILRQMPYSELRKLARKSGIKGNRKAENLIASILEKNSREDSFVTMERQIINSCSKNKEEKFNKDKLVASATPRRETYTVDCPMDDIVVLHKEMVISSASPEFRKSPAMNDSLNVTMTRGSEKKPRKRKVSFVTPVRKSMRLNTLTPQFASIKDRPKTPIPSRISSSKKLTPHPIEKKSLKLSLTPFSQGRRSKTSIGVKEKRPSTPLPQSKQKRMKKNSLDKTISTASDASTTEHLPLLKEVESEKSTPRSAIKKTATPGSLFAKKNIATPVSNAKRTATPAPVSASRFRGAVTSMSAAKKNATPSTATARQKKATTTPGTATSKQRKATTTPNFTELHQKAFNKMESIDDYQKRRAANSAKKLDEQKRFQDRAKAKKEASASSKIPKKFGGIPFVPSVTSIRDIKTNFALIGQDANSTLANKKAAPSTTLNRSAMFKRTPLAGKKISKSVSCENTPLKKKAKFDLQASLSKKLPYKPHSGPLKPLGAKSLNTTLPILPSDGQKKETENLIVKSKRVESRALLKGVRTNRRFDLQMKNRKTTAT